MNRKARRRAIWLLERRRFLRDAADGPIDAVDAFRFSLGHAPDVAPIGNPFRQPYCELQTPSNR